MTGVSRIKILSQKVEYTAPPMDVIRFEIEDGKGKIRPYWMIDRKRTFSVVIPLFPDKSTILVGQYRVPIKEFTWEFAMGTVDNAAPLSVAKQELAEETGVIAKSWRELGSFYLAPGISSQIGHVFLAENLTQGEPQPEEDEELITKRVKIIEVKDMIEKNKIKDGPTIIAWQFLQKYL